MPLSTDLRPGAFVFTIDGVFAGVVVIAGGRPTLVPGETVMKTVNRLRRERPRDYGQLGIEARPLTPDLASTTGAEVGVVVTWLDPQGPAAGLLNVTDVIVAMGDESLSTYEQWRARTARTDHRRSHRAQRSPGRPDAGGDGSSHRTSAAAHDHGSDDARQDRPSPDPDFG